MQVLSYMQVTKRHYRDNLIHYIYKYRLSKLKLDNINDLQSPIKSETSSKKQMLLDPRGIAPIDRIYFNAIR